MGRWRWPEILRIGMQTAAGLAAAHAQGLVHRDVKPANILLENGIERVKLTDFGLARAVADAGMTQSGVVAGTPHYMAPEQARGEATDHRADLFSLGSTLYAMCAGHPPFRAETPLAVLRRVSDDEPRPLREINPGCPRLAGGDRRPADGQGPARRFQPRPRWPTCWDAAWPTSSSPFYYPCRPSGSTPRSPSPEADGCDDRSTVIAVLAMIVLAIRATAYFKPWKSRGPSTACFAIWTRMRPESRRPAFARPDLTQTDEVQHLLRQAQVEALAIEAGDPRHGWRRRPRCSIGRERLALSRTPKSLERDILSGRARTSSRNRSFFRTPTATNGENHEVEARRQPDDRTRRRSFCCCGDGATTGSPRRQSSRSRSMIGSGSTSSASTTIR